MKNTFKRAYENFFFVHSQNRFSLPFSVQQCVNEERYYTYPDPLSTFYVLSSNTNSTHMQYIYLMSKNILNVKSLYIYIICLIWKVTDFLLFPFLLLFIMPFSVYKQKGYHSSEKWKKDQCIISYIYVWSTVYKCTYSHKYTNIFYIY